MKNSGLVNFIPGSCLLFVLQISSIYGKTAVKAWNYALSKVSFNKWSTNLRLEYFVRKNRTTFSDVPLLPEIFQWRDTESPFSFTCCSGKITSSSYYSYLSDTMSVWPWFIHVFVFIIKSFRNSYFLDALFKLWRHEGLRGLYKVSLPC